MSSTVSIPGPIWVQTATATVANTLTETTLLAAGNGNLTLPANFLTVGKTIKITGLGTHSSSGNPTVRMRIYMGATVLLDTGLVNTANSTNAVWEARGLITCRTVGATGTVRCQGFYEEDDSNASPFGMPTTAPITINTTVTQTLNITYQWGTAAVGNTISCTNLLIESVG